MFHRAWSGVLLVICAVTAASWAEKPVLAAQFSRPASRIRADLADHFHCRWEIRQDRTFGENMGRCWGSRGSGLDIVMSTLGKDEFSYLEFRLATRLQYEGGASPAQQRRNRIVVARDRANALWLLDYFLPHWAGRKEWFDREAGRTRHIADFHSLKIGDLGVALAEDGPVDRDDTVVKLGITVGDPSQWAPPN